MPTKV
jgi:phospholipid-transporting ATPase